MYLYADDAKIYKVINQVSDQLDLQATMDTVKTGLLNGYCDLILISVKQSLACLKIHSTLIIIYFVTSSHIF